MNKNILIIGGTSGIGKALVELLQDSNQLFVANRTSEGLDTQKVTYIPFARGSTIHTTVGRCAIDPEWKSSRVSRMRDDVAGTLGGITRS